MPPSKFSLVNAWLRTAIGRPLLYLGIDPRKTMALRFLPRFLADYFRFRKAGGGVSHFFPILDDYSQQAGTASGHYFHQELLVASFIHDARPVRHIDIGSRIDGFVAHVAAFRQIEVLDVRDLKTSSHANIRFLRADLMVDNEERHQIADSISCLHAIEHFGLGRYGDPINPDGHVVGFNNILKMLAHGGLLYVSFPIGRETSVYFNAHRVFHPHDVFGWTSEKLELVRFDYVDDRGDLHTNFPLRAAVPQASYGCGIYTFRRSL